MSSRLTDQLLARFMELRHEPIRKRVRARLGDETVVDSVRALVVYEPRRVVPSYAVPIADVSGELMMAATAGAMAAHPGHVLDDPALNGVRVLDPMIPFAVHSADGRPMSLRAGGEYRDSVGFLPDDPDLEGYVILDFDGFDAWFEEQERVVSHARDPFHNMEILASSRDVRVELDGTVLASSVDARLLVEGPVLPVRAYLPPEDILVELRPSAKRTRCAYKGEAAYLSADGHADIAWTYEAPLRPAEPITGLVCFFNERTDLVLGGERQPRPTTPWS